MLLRAKDLKNNLKETTHFSATERNKSKLCFIYYILVMISPENFCVRMLCCHWSFITQRSEQLKFVILEIRQPIGHLNFLPRTPGGRTTHPGREERLTLGGRTTHPGREDRLTPGGRTNPPREGGPLTLGGRTYSPREGGPTLPGREDRLSLGGRTNSPREGGPLSPGGSTATRRLCPARPRPSDVPLLFPHEQFPDEDALPPGIEPVSALGGEGALAPRQQLRGTRARASA